MWDLLVREMRPRLLLLCLFILSSGFAGAESPPRWLQIKTAHFTILSNGSDHQARQTAAQFERMAAVFAKLLPHAQADTGSRILVLALKNRKDFDALEPAAYLGKGALQLAGYFLQQQDRSYILLRLDTEGMHPYAPVYHEYTHYMMRHVDSLPLWLNEGLAEFYQNTDLDEKSARFGQPALNEIRFLREQRLLPLSTLFAVDHSSPYYHEGDKGNIFYAESWALTHWLYIQDFHNHTQHIQDYAVRVSKGESPVEAAEHVFGDLHTLGEGLSGYVNHGEYELLSMPLQNTVKEADFDVQPLPSADADALRADVLIANGRKEEGRALLDEVLKTAPDNAQAHESMGMLEVRGGNMREARKWYGEAVALHSSSYLAYYNYGALSLQLDGSSADDAAGASLRQAVQLNPHFARAYEALAHFDQTHNQLEDASAAMLQAIGLDLTNISYRLNAADIRVARKDFLSAVAILQGAQKLAKTPEEHERVDARLAQVKRYQEQQQRRDQALAADGGTAAPGSGPETAGTTRRPVTDSPVTDGLVTDRDGHVLHPVAGDAGKHSFPAGPPSGPTHRVRGVMHGVSCSSPKGLVLQISAAGKALALYSNDMYGIKYSAANFVPTKAFEPCQEFEGVKAIVSYGEVSDPTVAGQIVSIEVIH